MNVLTVLVALIVSLKGFDTWIDHPELMLGAGVPFESSYRYNERAKRLEEEMLTKKERAVSKVSPQVTKQYVAPVDITEIKDKKKDEKKDEKIIMHEPIFKTVHVNSIIEDYTIYLLADRRYISPIQCDIIQDILGKYL